MNSLQVHAHFDRRVEDGMVGLVPECCWMATCVRTRIPVDEHLLALKLKATVPLKSGDMEIV
jgi:hypothetical protein